MSSGLPIHQNPLLSEVVSSSEVQDGLIMAQAEPGNGYCPKLKQATAALFPAWSPWGKERQTARKLFPSGARRHSWFLYYVLASIGFALLLLIDPLFNKPNGLITTSFFTGKPSSHGTTPCSFDYEGSWQIGVLSGSSPLTAQFSNHSVLSCSSVANRTVASYIAEPCLVQTSLPGLSGNSSRWYAFYQVKNLVEGKGEIGVGVSYDSGASWQHLGTALSEGFPLSSPWVAYDASSSQYIMIPDTHRSRRHTVDIYTTPVEKFPFGWKFHKSVLEGAHFADTSAVHHNGQWWIYTTIKDVAVWGEDPSYSLQLFTADSLLGKWQEHPMSPITGDLRYARGGGRPFVMDGFVHRWAQDDSDFFGASLHLFKVDVLSPTSYLERYVKTIEPSGNGNWFSARTHHIDIQQIGLNGTWYGLVDGDVHKDGKHHFYHHEARFVRFKNSLLKVTVVQLLLCTMAFAIWHFSDHVATMLSKRGWLGFGKGETSFTRFRAQASRFCSLVCPEMELLAMAVAATVSIMLLFGVAPSLFYCPRWNIRIDVGESPPVRHADLRAPYNVSDLVIVTGASASFFDRMSNMIGSVHVWEPNQKIIIYDLGFSQSQLAKMMCWQNVEVRRFPYEKYPPHVKDVKNYAFKTLTIQEGLLHNEAVIWIDSGLELRAPMDRMKGELSLHGHVSALQEDAIGDAMYTMTPKMVEFFGLMDQWDTIRHWQFCAGGLQGFIRGSDADHLVLKPSVNCSLHQKECIAPEGSSRVNHNFDQTALTILIWHNNFSCLPRETHCMWSVKKASRDPLQLSTPIEVISRGHRQPKPYNSYIKTRPSCVPDKSKVPWPAMGLEHQESVSRYNLTFKISRIWLQPIGDEVVQTMSCIGAHVGIQVVYWFQLALCGAGLWGQKLRKSWSGSTVRMLSHLLLGSMLMVAVQLGALHLFSGLR